MRPIPKPRLSASEVFDACLLIAPNGKTSRNCLTAKEAIEEAAEDYELKATSADLYRIPRDQIPSGNATRDNLLTLYTRLRDNDKARYAYEEIKAGAAPDKCPYCGSGTVDTLDHYLPQSAYPAFAVTPINLVPSCGRCNLKKNDTEVTLPEKQVFHPYFDIFEEGRWLFASINRRLPVSANFFVTVPESWSDVNSGRVETHFNDLDLVAAYISDAANEFRGCHYEFEEIHSSGDPNALRIHLKRRANSHLKNNPNSWQTALYFACAESDWFCEGKFLRKG
ncbi:hypothetical protein N9Z02_01575 [Akkermansiaceae bacterium]|nr:hypothetical protein [Akkermansiaceae bacterium]